MIRSANILDKLETAHRWGNPPNALGQWVLRAREALRSGGRVDLRIDRPAGLHVVFAENRSTRHDLIQIDKGERRPIDGFVKGHKELFVLTRHNDVARGLRAFFNRSLPIWEGHTRVALDNLVTVTKHCTGDPHRVATAMVEFLGAVGRGFTPSDHGKLLLREVQDQCSRARSGKPAHIQRLARVILDAPNHKGVAMAMHQLDEFISKGAPGFENVSIDLRREFWDAGRMAAFDDADIGLTEITRVRTYARRPPPPRVISTIHKAKGLDSEAVLVMPCDEKTFSNTEASRRLLYVAMSRARQSLMLVLSRSRPSPLFEA
jgi:DNA helicase-2/ATP-dependent DNA helicase PcrA